MEKIDRLLSVANRKAALYVEQQKDQAIKKALERMTLEQLIELSYSDVSDNRIKEIFLSVGGLDLLESG